MANGTLTTLTRYKAWADRITFKTVMALPREELLRPRATRFGNILHTLNHVYVIDDIFRAHLDGRPHGYGARNTERTPPLELLWERVQALDRWYMGYVEGLTATALAEVVRFEFLDGGEGALTREAIILHVVNHGSYHRGFVSDMLYQVPAVVPANDLSVFLQTQPNPINSDEGSECSAMSP